MGSRIVIPAVALLLIAAGVAVWLAQDSEPQGTALAPEARPAAPAAAPETARVERPADVETEEAPRRAVETTRAPEPAAQKAQAAAPAAPGVTGRVVDRTGRPVEGARVRLLRPGGVTFVDGRLVEPPRLEGTTGADGRFTIADAEPGVATLSARAAGFAPLDRTRVSIPASQAGRRHDLGELVLSGGAILSGRVVDSIGRPVEGAELFDAKSRSGFAPHEVLLSRYDEPLAVTGPDGGFRVEELACGPWKILVQSDEHPSDVFEGQADVPGVEVGGLELRLPEGASIAGRVVGAPKDAAERLAIRARPVGEGGFPGPSARRGTRTVECEPGGTFVVRGLLAEQDYDLQVREAHDASHGAVLLFGGGARSDYVRARAGDRGIELFYNLGATLSFDVEDGRTGEPVVELDVACGLDWPLPVRDDEGRVRREFEDGRVEIDELFPRKDKRVFTLRVRATGYADYERKDVVLDPGQELHLGTIRLEPVPVVVVTVLDEATGDPVQGASVRLQKERRPAPGGGGQFSVEADVSIGGPDDDFVSLGGRVRSQVTDENGVAVLTSLEGETCVLSVRSSEHAPARVEGLVLPRGQRVEREVRLTRGGEVRVTVLDAEGEPLAGVKVEHGSPHDDPGVVFFSGVSGAADMTDSEGLVVFEHLVPGRHRFRLRDGSGGGAFMGEGEAVVVFEGMEPPSDTPWTEVDVTEGGTATALLQAEPRGVVEGRVREGGVPLVGATLQLQKRRDPGAAAAGARMLDMGGLFGGGGPTTTTDGDGYYAFEGVKPGEYTLEIRHSERVLPAERELELEDGGALTLRFDVDLSVAVIEGRLTDAEGTPLENVEVWCERRASSDGPTFAANFVMIDSTDGAEGFTVGGAPGGARARSGDDGLYRLRGVPEDVDLVVKASAPFYEEGESEVVRVAADEVRGGVDLELTGAGRLEVNVTGPDGSPQGMCMCTATFLDDDSVGPRREVVGPSGKVVLSGLRAGTWELALQAFQGPGGGGGTSPSQTAEVEVGETATLTLPAP